MRKFELIPPQNQTIKHIPQNIYFWMILSKYFYVQNNEGINCKK